MFDRDEQITPFRDNEDVVYSPERADADDLEAQKRADAADERLEIRP
ncbi:MAG: YfhD family protein [Brevibacillus sp.]|nr:YfhD family protein [Brevibacillus sp.]